MLVGAADPVEQAGSAFFGVTYEVATVAPAARLDRRAGRRSGGAAEADDVDDQLDASPRRTRTATYNVYFYDSVIGRRRRLRPRDRQPGRQDRRGPSVTWRSATSCPLKLTGANGLIGARAGQTVGHYIKLISLSPDGEPVQAVRHLARARDRDVRHAVCNGLPAGGAGEDRLEKYIADNLLPWAAGDFAPLEAGVIDEDTYVEQGRDLERAYSLR